MHDANGNPLQEGDHVIIRCVITSTSATEEYCNCGIETVLGRRPDGEKECLSAVNTGVMEKLAKETVALPDMAQPAE